MSNEIIAKIKPAQFVLLLTLVLPLVAMPTIYLFITNQKIFLEIDTSKLLLLSFSVAAPIFGIFYGVGVIRESIGGSVDPEKANSGIYERLTIAGAATVSLFVLLLMGVTFDDHNTTSNYNYVLVYPILLSAGVGALSVIKALWRSNRTSK